MLVQRVSVSQTPGLSTSGSSGKPNCKTFKAEALPLQCHYSGKTLTKNS